MMSLDGRHFIKGFLRLLLINCLVFAAKNESERQPKLLNAFTVVSFPNDVCTTSDGDLGSCYTASECASLGGAPSSSCASGFGTCCFLSRGCGGSTSVNNTYFVSSDSDSSPCQFSVCKSATDICQIKLTFTTFNIPQPLTVATTGDATVPRTQCQSAQFSASTAGSPAHTLCGLNSDYHMYLDATDNCNKLDFTWKSTTSREWKIHIMQIECSAEWKPPAGCTQYFTGITGTFSSYNYASSTHLANQNDRTCIRAEQGYCSISYAAVGTTGFEVGSYNPAGTFSAALATANVEGYTGAGCSNDYLTIPFGGATLGATTTVDKFCGAFLNAASPSTVNAPVFSSQQPYVVNFYTNGNEQDNAAAAGGEEKARGYEISYTQSTTCP